MAGVYKTPGVYIEEIPKFPPSIAPVETAIPAFIGYTERALDGKEVLIFKATRITSVLEYENFYGTSNAERFTVDVDLNTTTGVFKVDIEDKPSPAFILYHCIKAFYANGGGPCYIVSVGSFLDGRVNIDNILKGLAEARTVDEVTLLISPEAVLLSDTQYGQWASSALQQCKELQDRFTILDVSDDYENNADITAFFRNRMPSGVDDAKYGGAYYPFIETAFTYQLEDDDGNNISFVRLYTEDGKAVDTKAALVAKAQAAFDSAQAALNAAATTLTAATTAKTLADDIKGITDPLMDPVPANIKGDIETLIGASVVSDAITQALAATPIISADLQTAVNTWQATKLGELNAADTAHGIADTAFTTAQTALNNANATSPTALITAGQDAFKALEDAEDDYNTELADFSNAYNAKAIADQIKNITDTLSAIVTDPDAIRDSIFQAVGEENVDDSIKNPATVADLTTAVNNWLADKEGELDDATSERDTAKTALDTAKTKMTTASKALLDLGDYSYAPMTSVKDENNALYNLILDKVNGSGVVLPPSSLIAGVYASVDESRGVWKAPANVSLSSIIEPTIKVSSEFQSDLNVDTLAGKSVNAIRSFEGKGTLVWGARTLAGNDNEWRYVSVRRFFIFVEESVKKATEQFVFEPNDANTWVKVQAMIENFLTTLWRQGAMQGIKPEHAFYVAVGLGKTMTALDILEGRMIVEIGMAAVRPAEFIILRFSHKMAES